MRDASAGADPDAPARPLSLPAAWDDRAAAALAELAPGEGPADLTNAADAWIRPVALRARESGDDNLAVRLHDLLRRRRAAPTAPVWAPWHGAAPPGFVLNLPAFLDDAAAFDLPGFVAAIQTAATALRLGGPAVPAAASAPSYAIGITDLDGLLARVDLDYDSVQARGLAANLAALLRGTADLAFAENQPDLLARLAPWPAPPEQCPVPGLAAAAAQARHEALLGGAGLRTTAILPPGPADALLGAETGGIAPAFSPVAADGTLTRAAAARLVALGLSPEAALAQALMREPVLAPPGLAAHQAMHDAVAPYLHAMPPRPVAGASPAPLPSRRELPARRRGYLQKASVGGHRIYVQTGEYPDGALGEVRVTLPRESLAIRGMMDSLAAALSLGLQHGVPLQDYVRAFALTRFGPAGRVEGDDDVAHATSLLDYLVRNLAHSYLGRCDIPEGIPEPPPPETAPLFPALPPQRNLRLVSNR